MEAEDFVSAKQSRVRLEDLYNQYQQEMDKAIRQKMDNVNYVKTADYRTCWTEVDAGKVAGCALTGGLSCAFTGVHREVCGTKQHIVTDEAQKQRFLSAQASFDLALVKQQETVREAEKNYRQLWLLLEDLKRLLELRKTFLMASSYEPYIGYLRARLKQEGESTCAGLPSIFEAMGKPEL